MRTVAHLLAEKAPMYNAVPPETPVLDALQLMIALHQDHIVVTAGDRYIGLFTEHDYTRRLLHTGPRCAELPVAAMLTGDLPMVDLHESVLQCLELMFMHDTQFLLVFDSEEHFEGIVTMHDLLHEVVRQRGALFCKDRTWAAVRHSEGGW